MFAIMLPVWVCIVNDLEASSCNTPTPAAQSNFFFFNVYTQQQVRIHDPEVKSCMLHQLGQPSGPPFFQDMRATNQVSCHQLDGLAKLWPCDPRRKNSVRICSSLENGQGRRNGTLQQHVSLYLGPAAPWEASCSVLEPEECKRLPGLSLKAFLSLLPRLLLLSLPFHCHGLRYSASSLLPDHKLRLILCLTYNHIFCLPNPDFEPYHVD